MKIDVEGWERKVILGGDWERYRPRVLVVENTQHETWEPDILAYRYLPAYFDGLNRFYVRREDEELTRKFSPPPNFFDEIVLHRELVQRDEYERKIHALEMEIEELRARQRT